MKKPSHTTNAGSPPLTGGAADMLLDILIEQELGPDLRDHPKPRRPDHPDRGPKCPPTKSEIN
jgi:hypothetical protein